MIIMLTIMIGLAIAAVTEGLVIRVIYREYRKQALKAELLTSIIQESHLAARRAEKCTDKNFQ